MVLMNVAHAPGFKFHSSKLHDVPPKGSPSMDSAGVHIMVGRSTFARGVSGSYVKATTVNPQHV